jgi:tetratricopeptide (TPR) repeat protein
MAYRNRAFVWKKIGRPEASAADSRRFSVLASFRGRPAVLKLSVDLGTFLAPNPAIALDAAAQSLDADPEDTHARYLLGMRHHLANRPDFALREYDRVLDVDPDHLHARFARAMLLTARSELKNGGPLSPEAADAIDGLLGHPRLDELVSRDPRALRAYHYVARNLLLQGRIPAAIELDRRVLADAYRVRLAAAGECYDMRGEAHFALAIAYAFAGESIPNASRMAAEHLGMAASTDPGLTRLWLERDPFLDSHRETLRALLDRPTARP